MNLTLRQEIMSDFFEKQHIEGLPFPAVIHHFTDIDRGDPHDHPFGFTSHVLFGAYKEEIFNIEPDGTCYRTSIKTRTAGSSHVVYPNTVHKIIGISKEGCYTLITPEEWVQEPAFYQFRDGLVYRRQWNENEFKPLRTN